MEIPKGSFRMVRISKIIPEDIFEKLKKCYQSMYGKSLLVDIKKKFVSIMGEEPVKSNLKKREILPEYFAYILILIFEQKSCSSSCTCNEEIPNHLLN